MISHLLKQALKSTLQKKTLVPAAVPCAWLSFELLQSCPCTLSGKWRGRSLCNLHRYLSFLEVIMHKVSWGESAFPFLTQQVLLCDFPQAYNKTPLRSSFPHFSKYYYSIVKIIYMLLLSFFWDKAICPWKSQNAQFRKEFEFLMPSTACTLWESPPWMTRKTQLLSFKFFSFELFFSVVH